ncbi:hypothetical protein V5O48_002828, partial [Marasmius crinis-equi]
SPDSSHGYLYRGDDLDTEDDATSASYDGFSRFGSIASVANSDSSNTSAYYSEVGSCVSEHELGPEASLSRRTSCTAGQFIGLMSGLAVTTENHGNSPNGLYEPGHPMSLKDGDGTRTYPSPSSTVSPGGSPTGLNPANGPVTTSNELSYGMQNNDQSVLGLHSGSPVVDADAPFYAHDNNSFPAAPQFGDYHFTSVDGQDNADHYPPEGYHAEGQTYNQPQDSYCINPPVPPTFL